MSGDRGSDFLSTDDTDDADSQQTNNNKKGDSLSGEAPSVESVKSVDQPVGVGIERRDALKAMAAASGLVAITGKAAAQAPQAPTPSPKPPAVGPRGTPTDPDLLHPKKDWPRKLSARELATLSALCDTIIPADDKSPAASTVGVPAYINEYVSAPYDGQMRDLVRVRGGLAWLNTESTERFGKTFVRLSAAERSQICDDICYLPRAKPEFQAAARFFDLIRDLTAVGFYTTDAGMRDLQYIGNMALPKWDGPPPEVLRHLGL
jgi:gluconate 2-dehydrogenase gamma chain